MWRCGSVGEGGQRCAGFQPLTDGEDGVEVSRTKPLMSSRHGNAIRKLLRHSHLLGLEVWTLSELGAEVLGLSRLRERLEDAAVLGGQDREGQELNVSPEPGLPVWVPPPPPQALLVLIDVPVNFTDISTDLYFFI